MCAGQTRPKLPQIACGPTLYILVMPDGTVRTWGRVTPELSLGSSADAVGSRVLEPRPLEGIRNAVGAAVGTEHALILLADGTLVGWGRNSECEVGNGQPGKTLKRWERLDAARAPVPVTGLRGVVQVAAGDRVSGAVLADGTVRVWGSGNEGVLANGNYAPRGESVACAATPQPVEGLTGVRQLAFGSFHALAVRQDGSLVAWGRNKEAQLGDGTREARPRPVAVPLTQVADVAALINSSAAVLADGTVRTWGMNSNGKLGLPAAAVNDLEGMYEKLPKPVPGITGASSVRASFGFVMVRLKDSTLRGWGEGYYGALGNGVGGDWSFRPQAPRGLGPVLWHAAGGWGNLALRADGTVMGWGRLEMKTLTEVKGNALVPVPALKLPLERIE